MYEPHNGWRTLSLIFEYEIYISVCNPFVHMLFLLVRDFNLLVQFVLIMSSAQIIALKYEQIKWVF